MGDEEIIRRRLLIDGDGTGDARLMTKFTKALVKWSFSEDGCQESQAQYERLLTTLASVEQSASKWDNILQMNDVQIEHYDEIRSVTVEAVTDAQAALDGAKEELTKAREVRNHSLQYHALAKLIQEHPPRSPTAEKLDKLDSSLSKLKTTRDQLDDKLNLRKKQLHCLFTALQQLQSSLETEESRGDAQQDPSSAAIDGTDNTASNADALVVDLTEDPANNHASVTAPVSAGVGGPAAAAPASAAYGNTSMSAISTVTGVGRLNGRLGPMVDVAEDMYSDMDCSNY